MANLAIALTCLVISSGCGARYFSASTEAIYKITPDGKFVSYESNKELQGANVEITEIDGKTTLVRISVDKAGTSEAVVAAALATQKQMMDILQRLIPLIEKAALSGS